MTLKLATQWQRRLCSAASCQKKWQQLKDMGHPSLGFNGTDLFLKLTALDFIALGFLLCVVCHTAVPSLKDACRS
jgi:hypothetical protein